MSAHRLRLAAAATLIALAVLSIAPIGAPVWQSLLVVAGIVVVACTFGHAALRAAGVEPRLPLIGRLVVGLPLTAVAATLLAQVGLARWAPLVLAVAVVAAVAYDRKAVARLGGRADVISWEALALAAAFRLFAIGSEYLSVGPHNTKFAEYWDFMWQLAMLKEGVFRGLPLAEYPLMTGGQPIAYHPAFLSMSAVTLQYFPRTIAPLFFGAILPLMYVAFVAAIAFAATEIARHHRGGLFAVGLAAASLAVGLLPIGVTEVIGDGGSEQFTYFMRNIPSCLAAIAVMGVLGILASDARRTRAWVVAGVLSGGILAIKAPVAVVMVPTIATAALLAGGGRRRLLTRGALASAAAGLASLACLPAIQGEGPAIGVRFALLAETAHDNLAETGTWLLKPFALLLAGTGVLGDVVFFLGYVSLVYVGWRILPLFVPRALQQRRGVASLFEEPAFRFAGIFVIATVLVGLTLVQPNTGRFTTWQVGAPPLRNLYWLGVVLGGASLGAMSQRLRERLPRLAAVATAALALALLVPAGAAIVRVRTVETGRPMPTDLVRLLQEIETRTPPDTLVVQTYDNEYDALVSGLAGRRTILERAEFSRDYFPGTASIRESAMVELVHGDGWPRARRWLEEHPVDLLIRPRVSVPASATVEFEVGKWVAVKPEATR